MSQEAPLSQESLNLCCKIGAPEEVLWNYLSTAQGLACWQADEVRGDLSSGTFSLHWPGLGANLDLEVAQVVVGKRLVLRAHATTVELNLRPGEVELIHRGLDTEDDLRGFESSWRTALSLLKLAATKHPGKRRSIKWLFQEVPPGAELLHCFFAQSSALAMWLGRTERDFAPDGDYTIELFGGKKLSGGVLYSALDVCLHVKEWNDGALVMRSLPGPNGSRVAALGLSTFGAEVPSEALADLRGALKLLLRATRTTQD